MCAYLFYFHCCYYTQGKIQLSAAKMQLRAGKKKTSGVLHVGLPIALHCMFPSSRAMEPQQHHSCGLQTDGAATTQSVVLSHHLAAPAAALLPPCAIDARTCHGRRSETLPFLSGKTHLLLAHFPLFQTLPGAIFWRRRITSRPCLRSGLCFSLC